MYITFNIELINNIEWVISSTTYDPTWRLICTLEQFQEWIESQYDMEIYTVRYHTEIEHEYSYYKKVDWDLAGEDFYYPEYVNYYTAKNKLKNDELDIF